MSELDNVPLEVLIARLQEFNSKLQERGIGASAAEFIPHKPTARQEDFLGRKDFEVLYGGAAGGGKSDALLMAALQYVDVPTYSALLLRRTYADLALPGAILDRAHNWLQGTGSVWNDRDKRWTFPSGSTLTFGYLDSEKDKYRYASAEFQYCVARDTPVLMANGNYRLVQDLQPGEEVATLQGPCRISKTHLPRKKLCVRVVAGDRSVTVSRDHRLLFSSGWVSPLSLKPIECDECDSTLESSAKTGQAVPQLDGCSLSDQPQAKKPAPQHSREKVLQEIASSPEGAQNDSSECCGLRPVELRPAMLSDQLVLHAHSAHQSERGKFSYNPRCARHRVPAELSTPDSRCDCLSCIGFGDGRSPRGQANDQDGTPSPIDAGGVAAHTGDPARTPPHTHFGYRYSHPYTSDPQESGEGVLLSDARICLTGEEEVWDLTIQGASHYISFGGFIHANCGFDELTQFPESWYRFLLSRLRRTKDVKIPLRVRSASNPGGIGHDWVRRRFVDSPAPGCAFVPATLADNPHLDRVSYENSLSQLDPTTREQLLHGKWIRNDGGLVYRFDEGKNLIDQAPECEDKLLAIDYGFTDHTAFTIWGWRPHDQTAYCLESFKETGLTPGDSAHMVHELDQSHKFVRIVADIGGLGKGYAEEARQRYGLPIQPAEKRNKRGYIEIMNGDFAASRIKIVKAKNEAYIAELLELPWDQERKAESPGFDNHLCDSGLYGYRSVKAYGAESAPFPGPSYGSPAHLVSEEASMLERLEAEANSGKPWWSA